MKHNRSLNTVFRQRQISRDIFDAISSPKSFVVFGVNGSRVVSAFTQPLYVSLSLSLFSLRRSERSSQLVHLSRRHGTVTRTCVQMYVISFFEHTRTRPRVFFLDDDLPLRPHTYIHTHPRTRTKKDAQKKTKKGPVFVPTWLLYGQREFSQV